jgi:hypothetical protein
VYAATVVYIVGGAIAVRLKSTPLVA